MKNVQNKGSAHKAKVVALPAKVPNDYDWVAHFSNEANSFHRTYLQEFDINFVIRDWLKLTNDEYLLCEIIRYSELYDLNKEIHGKMWSAIDMSQLSDTLGLNLITTVKLLERCEKLGIIIVLGDPEHCHMMLYHARATDKFKGAVAAYEAKYSK